MQTIIPSLFGKTKVKRTQTPRALTPFGGLASCIGFLPPAGGCAASADASGLATDQSRRDSVGAPVHRPCHRGHHRRPPFCTHEAGAFGPRLAGDRALAGADTVRGLFHRFTQGTIQKFWRPLWGGCWRWSSAPPPGSRWIWIRRCSNGPVGNTGAAKGAEAFPSEALALLPAR
jgi:hypothetical protein